MTAKTLPEGANPLDYIMGTVEPVEVQDTPGDNPPSGDPPASNPPSGDPPAGDPPAANPPSGDPPAGDQPPVTPSFAIDQNPLITEEQALSVLFRDKFKTNQELDNFLSLAEKTHEAIEPYRQVLEKVESQTSDPEIVALENFKKVTGIADQNIKGLAEKALAETASPLDVMVADIVLRIPSRAGRIEETRQELIQQHPELENGSALSIQAESELLQAKSRLSETMGKVSALPVAKLDTESLIQQVQAERQQQKDLWASALDRSISGLAQKHQEVQLFDGFAMKLDMGQMKQSIPQLVEISSSKGGNVTPEGIQEVLTLGYKDFIASNLKSICESYYAHRKMQEDREGDDLRPINRNPDTPPPAVDPMEAQRNYVLS